MTQPLTRAPVVLVSPAMAIGSGYYRPLIEAFEARGWQARALPRRGFERALPPASRAHDWTYADEIGDIADAVRRARAEDPGRPVLLLGHSLGAQLVTGYEAGGSEADGVITVGGALPYFRHYRYGGLPLALMAGVVVPATTALFGHLPRPAFGGPGARSLMREWARMVLTGRPPYTVGEPLETPSLIISLEGDELSPVAAVDALAELYDPAAQQRWLYRDADVPAGASNDHITWVRTPEPVVDRVLAWWGARSPLPRRVG